MSLLTRKNHWNLFGDFRGEFDRLFDRFFTEFPRSPFFSDLWTGPDAGYPTVNVWEDAQNLYAECELPGVKMDDLDVSVVGNELTIKGEKMGYALEKATVHRRERSSGAFSRMIRLPVEIEADKVTAEFKNGLLNIVLPKAQEARPKKIPVKLLK